MLFIILSFIYNNVSETERYYLKTETESSRRKVVF
jgi:hypothetical protein